MRKTLLGIALATVTISVVVSALYSVEWLLAWLAIALLPALSSPKGRGLLFVTGALVVLQTAGGLGAPKLMYVALVAISTLVALRRCSLLMKTEWGAALRFPMYGGGLLLSLVFLWAGVGLLNGASLTNIARDGFTYFLIAAAIPIAIDAGSAFSNRSAKLMIVAVSSVTALSFAVQYLAVRGVSVISLDRFALASVMATAVGISLGFVEALHPRRLKRSWLAFSLFLLICVLITGTRSGLVLLAAYPAAMGRRAHGRVPFGRVLGGILTIAVTAMIVLPVVASQVADPTFLQTRIDSAFNVLNEGIARDASGASRVAMTEEALRVWSGNPLAGAGLAGVTGGVDDTGGAASFYLDTPALYLAKFGLLGTLLLAIALALVAAPFMSRQTKALRSSAGAVGTGTFAVWIVALPFMVPTEDKGFSVAIFLMVLLLASSLREKRSELNCKNPDLNIGGLVPATWIHLRANRVITTSKYRR